MNTNNEIFSYRLAPKIYFKRGAFEVAITDLKGYKSALILTDKTIENLGYSLEVQEALEDIGLNVKVFGAINESPSLESMSILLKMAQTFAPQIILAFGGGAVIDSAKALAFLYANPKANLAKLDKNTEYKKKAYLICMPTTSGTGCEATDNIVIKTADNKKITLCHHAFMPDMVIIDPEWTYSLPPALVAQGGFNALANALAAFLSPKASQFSNGFAIEAVRLIFKYLELSYQDANHVIAREKMHYSATLSGMASSNSSLGLTYDLAWRLNNAFKLPIGIACAQLLKPVVKFNLKDEKVYRKACYIFDYAFKDKATLPNEEKIKQLLLSIDELKKSVGIAKNLKECGISSKDFNEHLEDLCLDLTEEQSTHAAIRPTKEQIKEILLEAFEG